MLHEPGSLHYFCQVCGSNDGQVKQQKDSLYSLIGHNTKHAEAGCAAGNKRYYVYVQCVKFNKLSQPIFWTWDHMALIGQQTVVFCISPDCQSTLPHENYAFIKMHFWCLFKKNNFQNRENLICFQMYPHQCRHGLCIILTCTGWSLWQTRRHCVPLELWLLW